MLSEIKKLESGDIDRFIELIDLLNEVFETQYTSIPDKRHLMKVLANPDFIVFIAIYENQIIGGLTAYTLDQYVSERPLAYIYDLAVKKEFQRKGIGKNLILELIKYGKSNGFEEIFVQADKIDDYAIEFYRKTPISNEEEVIHFYYTLLKS